MQKTFDMNPTLQQTFVLPAEVKQVAAKTWTDQEFAPVSPVAISQRTGEIQLCAAACVAAASIELRSGPNGKATFCRELERTGDRDLVRREFTRLGFDSSECDRIFQRNDSYVSERERFAGILSLLQ